MEKITVTLDLNERTLALLRELLPQNQKAPEAPAFSKAEAKFQEEPKTEAKPQGPTKTDVRAMALKLSKAGKQNELKAVFQKYGADKLSAIADADYPALLQDLEAADG